MHMVINKTNQILDFDDRHCINEYKSTYVLRCRSTHRTLLLPMLNMSLVRTRLNLTKRNLPGIQTSTKHTSTIILIITLLPFARHRITIFSLLYGCLNIKLAYAAGRHKWHAPEVENIFPLF